MVIIGRKPVPDEEPEPPKSQYFNGKSQIFSIRWIKGGFGPSSDHKKKGKKMIDFGSYEDEERFNNGYFNLRRLKQATQNFSNENKIGEGGFGPVYKGVLPDKKAIAVKKLSAKSRQGNSEFLSEISTSFILRHPNLVKLLGCCTEKNQLLLVYEYMENGSLQNALFGDNRILKQSLLNWRNRFKICVGIAKGLAFLQESESKVKIVHRDIKPSNILLDGFLNPRISDFGLAKLYEGGDQTHISTRIAGTIGYMAPEYAMLGILTEKADVYSFGVLTLELMSGKRGCQHGNDEFIWLPDLAYTLYNQGNLLGLIDEDLKTSISMKQAIMVLELALLCINMSPKLRPTMAEVVSILEGRTKMKTLPPPESYNYSNTRVVGFESDTTATSVPNLSSSSTERKVTHQGKVAVFCSHVTSKEEEDNTHTTFHGDLVSDAKDSKDQRREDGVEVLSSDHVVTTEKEEDNTHNTNHGDFAYDAKDSKVEGGGDGDTVFSSHVASKEEGNTHTAFHGDFVYDAKDSKGEGGEEAGSLIHTNVATSEPTVLNARSWMTSISADATKVEDEGELEYVEPFFEEGKHHIKCSDEEFETGCSNWKDSLVGYFFGEKAPLDVDKEVVETQWEVKGNVSIFSMGSGYFLFQFNCIEDKIRVLESSGLWHIDQRPLVLRKWHWKLKFDKAELKSLPVWVKIYNLPLFLWSSSFLSKVGSGLGIPLYVDQKTRKREKLDYARVCIEVDASKPLPKSWNISVKGVDYQLNLEYEWGTLRCANCCTFGHLESKCRLKAKETKQN